VSTAQAEPWLRSKLRNWLLWPLLMLLVLDGAASYWAALHFSDQAHDRSLLEIAREVALHVHAGPSGPRLEISPSAERVLRVDQDDRLYFRVGGIDGRVIGGDDVLPAPPAQLPRAAAPRFYDGRIEGEQVRLIAAWLPVEGAPSGEVLVQVAETTLKRQRLSWEILASVMVPQLLLILMALAAVYVGVARGLQPLQRLQRAVADRSHLDLSPVDLHDVPGEVRPLVSEVNALMLRLSHTLDFQNRFIADASHQLKTPVAGLKAQIELALRESDPDRLRHSLAQLYVGTERLSRLVRQLLSLARNEPGASALQLQRIDLAALALEISMEWVPQALEGEIDLGFDGQEGTPVWVDADPDRLRELMNNLIDNAVRYSHAGGRVTVGVAGLDDGGARLSISDDGPHIPVEERTRIFERFRRLLGTQADGSGLGLAIVSEIASLHGARITLEEDVDGVGNTFSVLFPASGSPAS
jgi:two-component system sensor histidine kinase TctE